MMTTSNGMGQDVLEKRVAYISKNNVLLQEFHFAHPSTLVNVNNISTIPIFMDQHYGTYLVKK